MDQTDNRIYRALGSGPAFPVNDEGLAHFVGAAAIDGITDSAERDRLYVEARARAVSGMSLRDYAAIHACIDGFLEEDGLLSMSNAKGLMHPEECPKTAAEALAWWFEAEARLRFMKADAMLRARGAAT